MRHVVPNASCAFFVNDGATDSVKVAFVAGGAAPMLQGLEMKMGERLTGWVAENQQPIVNSEAKLDLGSEAALSGLKYCLALPLVADGQLAGVLSLYSAEAFKEEQAQTLQFVMPHLAQMFLSLERRAASLRPPLRRNRLFASCPAANAARGASIPFRSRRAAPSRRRDRRRRSLPGDSGSTSFVGPAPVPEQTFLTVPSALTRAATAVQPRLTIGS